MQFTATLASLLLIATSCSLVSAAPALEERTVFYIGSFFEKTCSTQAPDYMTYAIKGSLAECWKFCSSVSGCQFVNTYVDFNSAKEDGITCALYSKKHFGTSDVTNCGGQDQLGNGDLNKIRHSAGYNKF